MIDANVDFEAFSEVSLREPGGVGTCRYSEHPSTESLCMGWAIGDGEPHVWVPGRALFQVREAGLAKPEWHSTAPEELFKHAERGGHVYAWNVEMEIPFWEKVMSERHGWPVIPRDQWRDTAAMALTYALPASLEAAGAALGLDIVKDQRGKHLLNKLAKPRKPSKNDSRTRWEVNQVPEDYADLYDYCAQDVRAERAIKHALPIDDLDPLELELWQMTTEMNLRGWTVDMESAALLLQVIAEHEKRAIGELKKLTENKITTGNQRERMHDWMADHGVFLDDLTADTIVEALQGKLPPKVRRLLQLRQVLSKASIKKYNAMERRVCEDGTVKNNILHHGAATGRDAGRGMQIQNFPRVAIAKTEHGVEVAFRALRTNHPLDTIELLWGDPAQFASKLTRSHLTAAPGLELYCADFSSIENRLAVWHAFCQYGIDIFERGLDEYKQFAAVFYGVNYEDVTDAQRQHSKHAVLLFLFGGGEQALCNQALRFGTFIELADAKKLKRTYRKELYPEVVETWYGLDDAAKDCIRTGNEVEFNRVTFEMSDDFLMTKLPSGRKLAYYEPKIELKLTPWGKRKPTITHMGVDSKTKKWVRMKMIPGRNFENVVQGSARCAMMAGARRTTGAGYQLVGRIHDELASQMNRLFGSLPEYIRLMSTPDPWLDGIPIVAEGWQGFRFRK